MKHSRVLVLFPLISVAPIVSLASCSKQSEQITFEYSYNDESLTAVLTKYNGDDTNVTIPASVKYQGLVYSVVAIGVNAFEGCTNLESVTLSDSITLISDCAFKSCFKLSSVVFSENGNLTSIGNEAFANCSQLSSFVIPNTVISIGNNAFESCTSLSSIDIPDVLTTIGDNAFDNCVELSSVQISSECALTSIGHSAFSHCSKLTFFSFPRAITSIGSNAFWKSGITDTSGPDDGLGFSYSGDDLMWKRVSRGLNWHDSEATKILCLDDVECNLDGVIIEEIEYILNDENKTATVLHYYGANPSPLIPETIEYGGSIEYTVTSIGQKAFLDNKQLRSIAIPDSIESIEQEAFANCVSLLNVTFGEKSTLSSIGYAAFKKCSTLLTFEIPKKTIKTIGPNAFEECNNLANFSFFGTGTECALTSIGERAFLNCANLRKFVFPEGNHLSSINTSTFEGCSSPEFDSIDIPDSVQTIQSNAFKKCGKLQTVNFGLDSQLTTINSYAFNFCTGLTSVTLPKSIQSIDTDAFTKCNFSDTSGPDGGPGFKFAGTVNQWREVSRANAWHDPTSEQKKLTTIQCTNGLTCKLDETLSDMFTYQFFDDTNTATILSYVNSEEEIFIPANVLHEGKTYTITAIGNNAFKNNMYIKSVHFSSNCKITSIGAYAFESCKNLSSFDMLDTVTSLGEGVFRGCSNLVDIKLSISLDTISDYCFYNCKQIKSIDLPKGVTRIGDCCFQNCIALATINIPTDSILSEISDSAFDMCNSFTSIFLPPTLKKIKGYAFEGCSLTTIRIPNSVTTIGSYAFASSTLANITFEEGSQLTNIERNVFEDCKLEEIVLPDSITTIASDAFRDCENLISIILPSSLTQIGQYAFLGCDKLTTMTIPLNVYSIQTYALYSCVNITDVSGPDGSYGLRYAGTKDQFNLQVVNYEYAWQPQNAHYILCIDGEVKITD